MPECGFELRSAFSHILHYAPRSFCGIEMSNPIKKLRASRLSSAERAETPSFCPPRRHSRLLAKSTVTQYLPSFVSF